MLKDSLEKALDSCAAVYNEGIMKSQSVEYMKKKLAEIMKATKTKMGFVIDDSKSLSEKEKKELQEELDQDSTSMATDLILENGYKKWSNYFGIGVAVSVIIYACGLPIILVGSAVTVLSIIFGFAAKWCYSYIVKKSQLNEMKDEIERAVAAEEFPLNNLGMYHKMIQTNIIIFAKSAHSDSSNVAVDRTTRQRVRRETLENTVDINTNFGVNGRVTTRREVHSEVNVSNDLTYKTDHSD